MTGSGIDTGPPPLSPSPIPQKMKKSMGEKGKAEKKSKERLYNKGGVGGWRHTAGPNSFGDSSGILPAAEGFLHEAIEIVSRWLNKLVIVSDIIPCLFIVKEGGSSPTDNNTTIRPRE